MNTTLKLFTAFAVAATVAMPALAEDVSSGDLTLGQPYMRATPPNAKVAGGYMTITNSGSRADTLTGGSADFADEIQVHEMAMEGDVMRMRHLEGGLEIPAGGEVVLKPGSYHLMFMGLGERMLEGETRSATLTFEKAGEIDVDFPVKAIGAAH